jgi:thiol-disulfide isomerase/thioredoxin
MAKARPVLVTAVLSGAALLGYLTYRATIGPSEAPPQTAASINFGEDLAAEDEDSHDHQAAPEGPGFAERLPEFSLDTLAGTQQSISSWPGKPLLINFWATWCGPCLREIPMLKEYQTSQADVQVIGIAADRRDPVVAFADQMQFNYPILIGEKGGWEAAAAFGVNVYALPFTVFTAADGSVIGVHTGELHDEHLQELSAVVGDLRDGKIDIAVARERLAGRM